MKRSRFSTIAASIAIILVIIIAVSFFFSPSLQNKILDHLRYLLIAIVGIVAGWKMMHPSKKDEEEKDERKSPKPFVGIVVMVVGVMLLVGLHLLHVPFVNPLLLFALALIIFGLILHVRAMKRESNY